MFGNFKWIRSTSPHGGTEADRVRWEAWASVIAAILAISLAGLAVSLLLPDLVNLRFKTGVSSEEIRYSGTMTFPGDEWDRVSPESQGVDSRKLNRAIASFDRSSPRDGVKELVVIRNGEIIWAGHGIDQVHGIWSMTKPFSSTVLGLLIEEGKCELETRVAELIPDLRESYPDMTLRDLATMTSGYRAEGDWPPTDSRGFNGGSRTPFTPAEPFFEPGTHFSYWDSAMNQLANALTRIAGESMESVFERRIAGPIGMNPERWGWRVFTRIDGIDMNGGSGNKGKHLELSARELARFGHLMLNRGRWEGRQILSEAWVDQATSVQVPADLPLGEPMVEHYDELFLFDGRGVYGFNWWVNGIKPDGRRLWPDLPEGTFAATGYNNNVMFVIPGWRMVIVRLGLDGKDRRIKSREFSEFLGEIGKAIVRH